MKNIDSLLAAYLKVPPRGAINPDHIKTRLLRQFQIANHPEQFSGDNNPVVLAATRRNALQNIRRLGKRYPTVVDQLLKEHKQGAQ